MYIQSPFSIEPKSLRRQIVKELVTTWSTEIGTVTDTVRSLISDKDTYFKIVKAAKDCGQEVWDWSWKCRGNSLWESHNRSIGGSVLDAIHAISVNRVYSKETMFGSVAELWDSGRVPVTDGKDWYVLTKNGVENNLNLAIA